MVSILLLIFFFQSPDAITGKCKGGSSMLSHRLHDSHPLLETKTIDLRHCFHLCKEDPECAGANFKLFEGTCELSRKNHITHPKNLEASDGYVYMPVIHEVKTIYRSCSQIKEKKSSAASGVYSLLVNGLTKNVYCDMGAFGGGWSLVVSISASNNQHTIRAKNNCFNSSFCVPLATGTLAARKQSDACIRSLASHEGTFRVDVTDTSKTKYTIFYRLPKGAQHFDSGCEALTCPRMIISHSYPYVWESNCKGATQGYQIGNCHRVFDGHDNSECGTMWTASKYSGERVLYSYCHSNGIYSGRQGNLYVR